ncbi:hypothetical protein LPN04_32060 [Rugamonas sp. A1-17]|nr:hypothetical protein [Rugamonas sp. A1-17]
MPDILLTPNGYKAFITHLRQQFAGRPNGTVEYNYMTTGGVRKSFRFRTNDEYITAVKNSAAAQWQILTPYQEHYSHMASPTVPVGLDAIETALSADFSQPFETHVAGADSWNAKLKIICAFTSEAARSNPVYRACQLAVHRHANIVYNEIWPFINTYDNTRTANGIAANVFRPLESDDYFRRIQT